MDKIDWECKNSHSDYFKSWLIDWTLLDAARNWRSRICILTSIMIDDDDALQLLYRTSSSCWVPPVTVLCGSATTYIDRVGGIRTVYEWSLEFWLQTVRTSVKKKKGPSSIRRVASLWALLQSHPARPEPFPLRSFSRRHSNLVTPIDDDAAIGTRAMQMDWNLPICIKHLIFCNMC